MSLATSPNCSDIEIAIICALPFKARAIKAILQETSEAIDDGAGSTVRKSPADTNAYTVGRIASYPVVMVHMSSVGKVQAASVAINLKHSYSGIKLALLVGTCGGVPNEHEQPKRTLGDVIIGTRVVQYDFGKQYPDKFESKEGPDTDLGQQSPEIRAFTAKLMAKREALAKQTEKYFKAMIDDPLLGDLSVPEKCKDDLYAADYWHMHHLAEDCKLKKCVQGSEICDDARILSCEELGCDEIERSNYTKKSTFKPDIHFGVIASGDAVMTYGEERDRLAKKVNAVAFDREAAGVWNSLPCVVVEGICDYADSHKDWAWQGIAALTAAACAKAIIEQWHLADQPAVTTEKTRLQNVYIRDTANVGFVGQDITMRDPTFSFHQVSGQER
ncbi:hypothetical protein ACHAQJ_003407 [Trichoderma viride]